MKHALLADTQQQTRRGAGIELRLHHCDPDAVAAARPRELGFRLLDGPRDQPDHGLREAHLVDDDGYVWVARYTANLIPRCGEPKDIRLFFALWPDAVLRCSLQEAADSIRLTTAARRVPTAQTCT